MSVVKLQNSVSHSVMKNIWNFRLKLFVNNVMNCRMVHVKLEQIFTSFYIIWIRYRMASWETGKPTLFAFFSHYAQYKFILSILLKRGTIFHWAYIRLLIESKLIVKLIVVLLLVQNETTWIFCRYLLDFYKP